MRLVDTAGLRRKARVTEGLEKLSTADTIRAITFAEVVILVMDAANAFETQDLQIADLCEREGRALLYCIAKWDLVEDPQARLAELRLVSEEALPQLRGSPLVALSAETGRGVDKLMPAVFGVHKNWSTKVKTRDLNDWLAMAVQRHPPPAVNGRRIKPKYMAQTKARPPTLRAVRLARRPASRQLPPLPDQQPARELRPAGRAHAGDRQVRQEPLRRPRRRPRAGRQEVRPRRPGQDLRQGRGQAGGPPARPAGQPRPPDRRRRPAAPALTHGRYADPPKPAPTWPTCAPASTPLDRELVALLSIRQRYMDAAARIKTDRGAVHDAARIEEVVAKVKAAAREAGLSDAIAEPVWRELIARCIAHELDVFDRLRAG